MSRCLEQGEQGTLTLKLIYYVSTAGLFHSDEDLDQDSPPPRWCWTWHWFPETWSRNRWRAERDRDEFITWNVSDQFLTFGVVKKRNCSVSRLGSVRLYQPCSTCSGVLPQRSRFYRLWPSCRRVHVNNSAQTQQRNKLYCRLRQDQERVQQQNLNLTQTCCLDVSVPPGVCSELIWILLSRFHVKNVSWLWNLKVLSFWNKEM